MYRFVSLFTLGLFELIALTNSFKCPNGSIQINGEDVCILLVTETDFYLSAGRRCRALDGIPVKITNVFENTYVFATVEQSLGNVAPYIGVERAKGGGWTYADGSPLTYQNWATDEPSPASNTSLCAIMNSATGKWMSAECSIARPYFCSINGDDSQCPAGWIYSETFDYCYYLQNFTYIDEVQWLQYNWSAAEGNCRRLNSHLASIHSEAESNFLLDLVKTSVVHETKAVSDGHPCWYQWAWIGLYGSGAIGNGTWSDESPVDYVPRTFVGCVPSYWLIGNDSPCSSIGWAGSCPPSNARYLCKMVTKNRLSQMNSKNTE